MRLEDELKKACEDVGGRFGKERNDAGEVTSVVCGTPRGDIGITEDDRDKFGFVKDGAGVRGQIRNPKKIESIMGTPE